LPFENRKLRQIPQWLRAAHPLFAGCFTCINKSAGLPAQHLRKITDTGKCAAERLMHLDAADDSATKSKPDLMRRLGRMSD
jgi:hypothetical protein